MAIHDLDNDAWGIVTNCFVCEKRNPQGLRLRFVYDDEAEVVASDFRLGDSFSGTPGFLHGGVLLAVLDEAMAWAAIVIGKEFALTHETSTRFHAPVLVDQPYRVEASVEGRGDRSLRMVGAIRDAAGGLCAESSARFVRVDPDRLAASLPADTEALVRSGEVDRARPSDDESAPRSGGDRTTGDDG